MDQDFGVGRGRDDFPGAIKVIGQYLLARQQTGAKKFQSFSVWNH